MKGIRIISFSIITCLFLISTVHSGFSQVEQETFEEISDEDLELLEEFLGLGNDLIDEERYDEAISYYDRVLSIDSSDIDALNGKALALNSIGKHEEAITYYDRVFAIDSTDDDARYGKAIALMSLGREAEAIPLLEKIIEENTPALEFREPLGEIADFDQILFIIVGVFVAILVSIIAIGFIARRRKAVSYIETPREMKQTISKIPSSKSYSSQKENEYYSTPEVASTNLEVDKAILVLLRLAKKNMLDNPKTAKKFLLSKGFSPNTVKNAMLSVGIEPSHVADLQ